MIGLYILAATFFVAILLTVWIVWLYNRGPRYFADLNVGTAFRFGYENSRTTYVAIETIGCGSYQVLREYDNGSDKLVYMASSSPERLKELRVFVV